MHPTLKAAFDQAHRYLDMLKPTENPHRPELEKELSKLTKEELIERVLQHEAPLMREPLTIEATVYRILSDPACVWLDHATIAALVSKAFGSKTKEGGLAWYSSKGLEKGQNVLPRKPGKAIAAMILSELV